MSEQTLIPYRLALTRLVISGTSETEVAGAGRRVVAATAQVALHTGSDPHEWLTLRLPDSAATDRSFTLTLTEDGRPLGTNITITGRAGSAVKSVVSTLTTVAGVAVGVLGKAALVTGALKTAPPGEAPLPTWEEGHPDLAARRAELRSRRVRA